MPKRSKRMQEKRILNYDAYDFFNPGYFGVIKKNGRVKIDTKRLLKIAKENTMSEIMEGAIKASQTPRNTAYFYPKVKRRDDYIVNQFRDEFDILWDYWKNTLNAIDNLQKPEDKVGNMRVDLVSGLISGDDLEEVDMKCNIAYAIAKANYHTIKLNLISQFIHHMATRLDALLIKVCRNLGLNKKKEEKLYKDELITFLQGYTKGKILDNVPNYNNTYKKFFQVWNLLKHNCTNLFLKLKENYPDMILNQDFENGELAQYYIKIDEDFVRNMLIDLEKFYEDMCQYMFNEDIEDSKWNYDDYFINNIINHNPFDY